MPSSLTESLFTTGVCLLAFGLAGVAYRRRRFGWALAGILLGGLALRLFAGADQYLHEWDEKYHALVARNLWVHPLRPTLFERPVLPYDYHAWYCNHIWLHKPPLPLWLMAGSIGGLGAHEWAVRLPSLCLSMLAIYLTYRMGRTLLDASAGLLAAFLYAVNGKLIELAAGRESSDHVETCNVVLFQVALWMVWANWQKRDSRSALLAGLFTGLTFLSKWTPAAFIPLIWLLGMLWQRQPLRRIFTQGALIGTGALLVAAPWMVWIAVQYPLESKALLEGVLRANSDIIETHGGPWFFYLDKMRIMFGELIYLPLLVGLYAIGRRPGWGWGRLPALALWIAVPLLFFSAAATKRDTYLLVAAPAFFLLTAWAVRALLLARHWRPARRAAYLVLAVLLLALPVRYGAERAKLFAQRERRPAWMDELARYRQQLNGVPPEQVVLFGVGHNIEMMFYTGITTYSVTPGPAELDRLKQSGYRVYLVQGNLLQAY